MHIRRCGFCVPGVTVDAESVFIRPPRVVKSHKNRFTFCFSYHGWCSFDSACT